MSNLNRLQHNCNELPSDYIPYLITFKELKYYYGISRTSAYRWMITRDFPKPKALGSRAPRLVRSEVEAWIADQPDAPVHGAEKVDENE